MKLFVLFALLTFHHTSHTQSAEPLTKRNQAKAKLDKLFDSHELVYCSCVTKTYQKKAHKNGEHKVYVGRGELISTSKYSAVGSSSEKILARCSLEDQETDKQRRYINTVLQDCSEL